MGNKAGRWIGMATALGALALWMAAPTPAAAELSFCPPGAGAGQCSEPEGVASDFESGNVFVADRGNHRVNAFKAETGEFLFAFGWGVDTGAAELQTCTTASTCQAGTSGSGAGQLSFPRWIAVDNVVGSPTRHDVYVVDSNNRVNHFKADGTFVNAFGWGVDTGAAKLETCTTASTCQPGLEGAGACQLTGTYRPVSVGPGGNVFLAVSSGNEPNFTAKVEKFSPAGACLGETILLKGNFELRALAVDAAEDAYVIVERAGAVLRKYDLAVPESAALCNLDPGIETWSIGLDAAGHLFAAQREPGLFSNIFQVVTEYDTACAKVRRFGYGKRQNNGLGIAALNTGEGDVLVSQSSFGIQYIETGPPGPIAIPGELKVPVIGNAQATARVGVNPEGKASEVTVQYVDEANYQADIGGGGNGFEGAGVKEETKPLAIPAGREFRANGVEFLLGCETATKELIEEGKCLFPETKYRWRIIATNADNLEGSGEARAEGPPFTTKDPIDIIEIWASSVDTTTATLNGLVDPLGIPATGHFEYVDEESFQESGFANALKAPEAEPEIDFGGGKGEVKRSVSLFPLQEGTTYHYRLAAINPLIEAFQLSEEKTFTTFRSPGPEPCEENEAFRKGPSALLPDCRAYELVSPLDKANGDIVVLSQELTIQPAVANQSATSGERLTYGSYRAFGDAKSAPYTSQYLAARDPEEGWESHGISPPEERLIKGIPEFDFEFRAFSDDLCEGWVIPIAEPPLAEGAGAGHRNLYRRTDELCGGESYEAFTRAEPENLDRFFIPEVQGYSADGSVAAFMAKDNLEGSGAPPQPSCEETDSGPSGCKFRFYLQAEGGAPSYACILPGGAPHEGDCSGGTSKDVVAFGRHRSATVTNALSADGSRIYWTDDASEGEIYLRENPLSEEAECSGPGTPCTKAISEAGKNSRFWLAAEDGSVAIYTTGQNLFEYDAEANASAPIAGGVSGVAGASKDASLIYFTSTEVLSGAEENSEGEKAVAGQPNLYRYETGGGGAYRFVGTLAAADANPTPIGRQSSAVAIQPSSRSSRVSPSGDFATFMSSAPLTDYDNKDATSGEADTEVYLYDALANGGAGELLCASCNPSGARPAGKDFGRVGDPFWVGARLPTFETTLYASRVLASDGERLFFEAQDALSPRDTNSRIDVYQWERVGKGGCEEGDPSFSVAASGCIDLVTSGQSVRDAKFIDASPTGEDVFFATLSSLLPEDYGLVDVYDARVGGGFPSPPPPPVECEGETCQSPPAPPPFQAPATAGNEGPGNLPPPPKSKPKPKPCAKGKHKAKRGGKVRCVPNKRRSRR